jgi:hypothetical protein
MVVDIHDANSRITGETAMIDENEFFRNATLKICGNLQMEQALHGTLLYLRKHIPIDTL